MGRHDLPARCHDHRRLLRQAVGHLRAPADAPHRHHDLPDRLRAVGHLLEHGEPHPLPRHPGRRSRRDLPGLARGHRRPLQSPGARPLHGPLRRGVRRRCDPRPVAGRLADRQRELALDLLRQPAHRGGGPLHHLPLPAVDPRRAPGAQARLPGRRRLHDRGHVPAPGTDEQAVIRVGQRRGGRLSAHRRGRGSDLPLDRVARRRAHRAPRPVPRPQLRGDDPRHVPCRHRLLRGDRSSCRAGSSS